MSAVATSPASILDPRAALLSEREELVAQVAESSRELEALFDPDGPIEVQFDDESGEGAGLNVELDRIRARTAQLRAQIDEIGEALRRVDDGTYGRCESCGRPIASERLEAVPTARRCVACKTGGLLARAGRR
ncbi:MAG: TraR/DksA family transcriptional regulator [Acidimicrobiales bacterium]